MVYLQYSYFFLACILHDKQTFDLIKHVKKKCEAVMNLQIKENVERLMNISFSSHFS